MLNQTPQWEAGKENTAPLRCGRRVQQLEQSLTNGLDEDTRISSELQILEYERLVRNSEADGFNVIDDDDPLKYWVKYLQFHQMSFPTDTINQLKLVERCFRAMCKLPIYKNDERFVKICCVFADKSKRPHDIFKYCHEQQIGIGLSIFWIAWAFVAEKEENFPFAEKIFEKGIRKKAAPAKLLQQRLKHFQRRMSRHWLNSTQICDDADGEHLEPSTQNRGALGNLNEEAVTRNDRSRNNYISQSTSHRRSHSPLITPSMAPFPIFADEIKENGNNILEISQQHTCLRSFTRSEDVVKENVLVTARWNQYGALSSRVGNSRSEDAYHLSSTHGFQVFVDQACLSRDKEPEIIETNLRYMGDSRTFRSHVESSVGEKLTEDPLRYVKDPSKLEKDQTTIPQKAACHQTKTKEPLQSLICKFSKNTCCEEERFKARYYKTLPSNNISKHHDIRRNSAALMTAATPLSAIKLVESHIYAAAEVLIVNKKETICQVDINEGRRLTQNSTISTPRNESTSSSTVEVAMAVGTDIPDIEQTINSAWAQKEISMMFLGSPTKDDNVSFTHICAISESNKIEVLQSENELFDDMSGDLNSSFAPISYDNPHSLNSELKEIDSSIFFKIYEDKCS